MSFNNFFMLQALKEAESAFNEKEIPVGAVIVDRKKQKIIAVAHNLVEQRKIPTFHAEIIAINTACDKLLNKSLEGHDIYVSLEPCGMCAAAIANARIDRIFYSAPDPKHGAIENNMRFFNGQACFHRPEIYGGFFAERSKNLMQEFFRGIRANKNLPSN